MWPLDILKCSPSDTDSKYIHIRISNMTGSNMNL